MQEQAQAMQLQQLQTYLQYVEEQLQELAKARDAIDELTKETAGKKAYVPLTNGIYVRATLQQNNNFLINAGNNVLTELDAEKTKEILGQQQEELTKAQEQLVQQFTAMYEAYLQEQMTGQ